MILLLSFFVKMKGHFPWVFRSFIERKPVQPSLYPFAWENLILAARFRSSKGWFDVQNSSALNLEILTALIAAAAPLDGLKLHLAVSVPTPSQDNVVSDFGAATFTGSAAQDVVWLVPYFNGDGNADVPATELQFICTAGTPDETIVAYFVTDTAGTELKFWDMLPVPVHVGKVHDGLTVELDYVAQ